MRKSIAMTVAVAVFLSSCASGSSGGAQQGTEPPALPFAEAEQAWRAYNCLVGPGQSVSTYADNNDFECAMRRAMAGSNERVTVNFSATDPALVTQTADGRNIRGLLPARMQRWAQAVNQSNGKVVVCPHRQPEDWGLLLGLATWVARVVIRQLMPQGEAFYMPAATRDLTLTYTIVSAGQGARLTKAEFDRRPVTVTSGCSVVPAA